MSIKVTKCVKTLALETLRKASSFTWCLQMIWKYIQYSFPKQRDEGRWTLHVVHMLAVKCWARFRISTQHMKPANLKVRCHPLRLPGQARCGKVCKFSGWHKSSCDSFRLAKYNLVEKPVFENSSVLSSRIAYSKDIVNLYNKSFIWSLLTFYDWSN